MNTLLTAIAPWVLLFGPYIGLACGLFAGYRLGTYRERASTLEAAVTAVNYAAKWRQQVTGTNKAMRRIARRRKRTDQERAMLWGPFQEPDDLGPQVEEQSAAKTP